VPQPGLYLVDKPVGPTSFGVLRSLRPALGRKLGHAGTLDPFASGLLLVLAEAATRLAPYLSGVDKTYRAVVQFGEVSTTLDPEGTITMTGGSTDRAAVEQAAAGMTGEVLQRVPAASAVKVAGERSYARMRRGEDVVPEPRMVRIDRIDVAGFDARTQRAEIEVACSKGTYVRQIAADLGEQTGAGAMCFSLRRLTVGAFDIADAGTPEQVAERPDGPWYRTPAEALRHLPSRELTADEATAVAHGRPLEPSGEDGPTAAVLDGELVAVMAPREGLLRSLAVFRR
jgi:tRNA pseudouridine55 synthase